MGWTKYSDGCDGMEMPGGNSYGEITSKESERLRLIRDKEVSRLTKKTEDLGGLEACQSLANSLRAELVELYGEKTIRNTEWEIIFSEGSVDGAKLVEGYQQLKVMLENY